MLDVYEVLCSTILLLIEGIQAHTNNVLCWDAFMFREGNWDFMKRNVFLMPGFRKVRYRVDQIHYYMIAAAITGAG